LRALSSDSTTIGADGNNVGNGAEQNAPIAFFELSTRQGAITNKDLPNSGTRFEMTLDEVKAFNATLENINKAIKEAS
jgi:hypothetical protein